MITDELLNALFADVDTFVGSEDTIHAQLYHNLLQNGYSVQELAREWRPKRHPYDMAVLRGAEGQFKQFEGLPSVILEVKGGAYNTRNALHDRISLEGYCEDHKHLSNFPQRVVDKWFICVDMSELGRAILPQRKGGEKFLGDIVSQSSSRDINTAYFCQGDDRFYVARLFDELMTVPLRPVPDSGVEGKIFETLTSPESLESLRAFTGAITGHESNYTAYLYHLLRNFGYSPRQLSLETYFKFAPRQQRPDMTIYSSEYDGKFNLYPRGDKSRTNDLHKCRNLRGFIEIKAKQTTAKYIGDIEKLAQWRQAVTDFHSDCQPEMIFIAFDTRARPTPEQELTQLVDAARRHSVRLIYLSRCSMVLVV